MPESLWYPQAPIPMSMQISPLPLRTEAPPANSRRGRPKSDYRLALEVANPGQAFDVPNDLIRQLKSARNTMHSAARSSGKCVSIRTNDDGSITVYVTGTR